MIRLWTRIICAVSGHRWPVAVSCGGHPASRFVDTSATVEVDLGGGDWVLVRSSLSGVVWVCPRCRQPQPDPGPGKQGLQ